MSRIQKGLFAHWSLQVLCGENCSVWGSPIPACRYCKLYLECSKGKNPHSTEKFLGCSGAHWESSNFPNILMLYAEHLGIFFWRFLWGGIKISRKGTYVTALLCLQWSLGLCFIWRTGAAPVSRWCPGAPAGAFPLCSAGGAAPAVDMDSEYVFWICIPNMYSTHQASAELLIAAPALQPAEGSTAPQPSLHFNRPKKVEISIFWNGQRKERKGGEGHVMKWGLN